MKVIDCFTFYNEFDLLDLRLKELYDVVDWFILVEGNLTHSGKKKRFHYRDVAGRYQEYSSKILNITLNDMPTLHATTEHWDRENHQRRGIKIGLDLLSLKDEDIVVISDLDEIVNPELLIEIKKHGFNIFKDPNNKKYKKVRGNFNPNGEMFTPIMDLYYYNLECKSKFNWALSKITTYGKVKSVGDIQKFRSYEDDGQYMFGGWHLSYFGSPEFIVNKIQNLAHAENHIDKYKDIEYIKDKVDNKKDLYDRPHEKWINVPVDQNKFLPKNYKILL